MDIFGFGNFLGVLAAVYIWLHVIIHHASCETTENMRKMKAVKDKILKDYDKTIRPVKENSNTTDISTGFMPRQIIQLDEETALFTMDSYFWMHWTDPRLKWNNTLEFDGYLQLPADLLWIPDITVFNSHSKRVNPTQDVLLVVHWSGNVFWVPPLFTQTTCPSLSESVYPYDKVECIITLGSWTHDGWEIDFSHSEEIYMEEFENIHPRWELITSEVKAIRNVTYYDGYDEPYLSLRIHFPMKRRPVPELEATRAPCIMIMLLTLSIFWLPPDSSKKILLGGILFLVLTVLLIFVASRTRYPLAVLSAVSFLQSTMYLLVTTVLLQLVVVTKLCSLSGPTRPPPAIMTLINGPLGKYACLRSPFSDNNIPLDRVQLKEENGLSDSPTPKEEWVLFASAVDRLLFLIMAIVMIAVHHL